MSGITNPFSQEEIDKLDKKRQSNDKMEEYFSEKRKEWGVKANAIFDTLKGNLSSNDFSKVVDSQSLALSYRQALNDEISYFLSRHSKEEINLKKVKHDKLLFYSTGFGLKSNLGEKSILIDAHTSEYERTTKIIEAHIDFCRETIKSLESYQYSIRNIVSLYEYLGK